MKEPEIKIIYIEPQKEPQVMKIPNELKSFQHLVGGFVEVVGADEGVDFICNGEGKVFDMPLNRALFDDEGVIYDIIAGPLIICGADEDNGVFISLSEEQIKEYTERFKEPEYFMGGRRVDNKAEDTIEYNASSIAHELNDFMREYDFFDYSDRIESPEEAIEDIMDDLISGRDFNSFRTALKTIAEENPENAERANELLAKVEAFEAKYFRDAPLKDVPDRE
ncbi:MAG: DUF3846 domain-containing protein [Clostridiales bacterium]|nr:DUF3846 domain-containing protein [Clostridiales bacterium]